MNTKAKKWKKIIDVVALFLTSAGAISSFWIKEVSQFSYTLVCIALFLSWVDLTISDFTE